MNVEDDGNQAKMSTSMDEESKPDVPEVASSDAFGEKQPAKEPQEQQQQQQQPKKPTWKKPKDMPKRPLSAYNIFFQYQRSRIVEGKTDPPLSGDDIVRSIEAILAKGKTVKERKRNRKTHGRITFGDLARSIADSWKSIDPKIKSIFDHYAEVDMMRYKRELKAWKDKKEQEEEARTVAKHADFMNRMNASFPSVGSAAAAPSGGGGAEDMLSNLPDESGHSEPWNPRGSGMMNSDFNNSYSSVDSSASAFSYEQEPEPMQQIISRQQQILHQMRGSATSGSPIPNQGSTAAAAASPMRGSFASDNNNMMMMTMMQQQQQQQGPYGNMMMMGGNQHPNMQQQQMGMGMQPQMQYHQNQFQGGSRMMNTASMGSGGYNNWNSAMGNSSLNSLPANESLFTPSFHGQSNHVSDYSSSVYSGHNMSTSSGFNSSFSSVPGGMGFNPVADGLAPPSSSRRQEGGQSIDMSGFSGGGDRRGILEDKHGD